MSKFLWFVIIIVLLSLLTSCSPAQLMTPVASDVMPTVRSTNTVVPPTAIPQPTTNPALEILCILWDKTYHKTAGDMGEDVLVAEDGGFYIVGTTDMDLYGTGKSGDIYLIRTDENGDVLWENAYGGDKAEEGLSITRTSDGNLLLAGKTNTSNAGGADAYLVKVDLEGNEIWSKTYGSSLDEMISARELADGSFLLWGNVIASQDFVADPGLAGYDGLAGRSNIYLAKIDANGDELWAQKIGEKNNLIVSGGVEASDGGFVVLATLLRFPEPGDALYLLEVDKSGQKVWERTWEEGTTAAYDLIRTDDDQYLIAASVAPADDTARAMADFLFIKVDQQGKDVWISQFGDPKMIDHPVMVTQTTDGGYMAAGHWIKDWSGRSIGEISFTKIGPDGKLVWEKTIKPAGREIVLRSWLQLADGNFLLVGSRMTRQFEINLMKVGMGIENSAYLGQTPPGLEPQVFAPGLISTDGAVEFAASFSPDGKEFYFTRRNEGQDISIFETHQIEGAWTDPAPVTFTTGHPAFEPHVSADNQTLYFGWIINPEMEEIWAVDRAADGWSAPRRVGDGMFVSSDQNGQFYVTNFANRTLVKVNVNNGLFADPQTIGSGIHPAIAPNGSYLINDNGDGNLAVRFLQPDGTWSTPQSLAVQGIPAAASIASISPDGKYLFYTYQNDLYWVSTEMIANLQK